MQNLLEKLKLNNIETAIEQENNDFQFLSLTKLYQNIENKEIYLFLILANALVTYQLSGKWEAYWEEFSAYFSDIKKISSDNIIQELQNFITNSKNNKRLVLVKIQRLEKLHKFIDIFQNKKDFYYENMEILRDDLALLMNQARDAKTIVFAVKMFSYWARNYFNKVIFFPNEIEIPIDSRLETIYEKYNSDKNIKIKDFYKILSKELNIPPLHLDSIIWCNYEELKNA